MQQRVPLTEKQRAATSLLKDCNGVMTPDIARNEIVAVPKAVTTVACMEFSRSCCINMRCEGKFHSAAKGEN
jgi:hypothetical protein